MIILVKCASGFTLQHALIRKVIELWGCKLNNNGELAEFVKDKDLPQLDFSFRRHSHLLQAQIRMFKKHT